MATNGDRKRRLKKHAQHVLGSMSASGAHESLLDDGGDLDRIVDAAMTWRKPEGVSRDEVKHAVEAMRNGADATEKDEYIAEAIILPTGRPVADVQDGKITNLPDGEFADLLQPETKARLEALLPHIGCVLVPDDPRLPYGGTGFVVAPGLLMTNRHVAQLFCSGLGAKWVRLVQRGAFTPKREGPDPVDSPRYRVRSVKMIHPYWDMALLDIPDLPDGHVRLDPVDPKAARPKVAVVGYPAFDPRNDRDVQSRVFSGYYYVKRLSPGYLTGRRRTESFRQYVDAATHDASTLGGNSGSAVIDVASGNIVALHFAGRYLDTNYGVPAFELARDRRVIDAGVRFTRTAPDDGIAWSDHWRAAEEAAVSTRSAVPVALRSTPVPNADGFATLRLDVPIEISVRVGAVGGAAGAAPPSARAIDPELQALVEEGRRRSYYAASSDQKAKEEYYAGIDFDDRDGLYARLQELVTETHAQPRRYAPSRWVYPWVDLRPNGKLASIYSGQEFTPEELIQRDEAVLAEREALAESLLSEQPALSAADLEEQLEALAPYNCEHVVPQSWFDKREPMRGDLHHLFTCESRCNSFRGNRSYQSLAEEAVMTECGRSEGDYFEPERGRGAVARATLYFLLHYPAEINSPSELTAEQIDLLKSWAASDPVGKWERHRNQAIHELQGNRNPFIDFPELAQSLDVSQGLG